MDIRKLDLNLLPVLEVLLRQQSVTLAAKELNLSQSTLSGHLSRIRAQFHDPVLVRTSRGLRPTPKGSSLAPMLREVLILLEAVSSPAQTFEPVTSKRHFRVGCTETACWTLSTLVDAQCRRTAPGILCDWIATGASEISQALEAGTLDVAIGEFEVVANSLLQKRLLSVKSVCAVDASYRKTSSPLTLEEFSHCTQIRTPTRSGAHMGLDRYLAQAKLPPPPEIVVPSALIIPDLLRHTDRFAFLPVPLVKASRFAGHLSLLDLPFNTSPMVIRMYWHPRYADESGLVWLRKLVTELASGIESPV